jgi:hypothetical protein
MCPGCIAGVTWIVVGATSTGSVAAALVTKRLRAKARRGKDPRHTTDERESKPQEEVEG